MEKNMISVHVWARNIYAVGYGRLRLGSWELGEQISVENKDGLTHEKLKLGKRRDR
jgi:hypothetical protein